jgi:hypothetical protein
VSAKRVAADPGPPQLLDPGVPGHESTRTHLLLKRGRPHRRADPRRQDDAQLSRDRWAVCRPARCRRRLRLRERDRGRAPWVVVLDWMAGRPNAHVSRGPESRRGSPPAAPPQAAPSHQRPGGVPSPPVRELLRVAGDGRSGCRTSAGPSGPASRKKKRARLSSRWVKERASRSSRWDSGSWASSPRPA